MSKGSRFFQTIYSFLLIAFFSILLLLKAGTVWADTQTDTGYIIKQTPERIFLDDVQKNQVKVGLVITRANGLFAPNKYLLYMFQQRDNGTEKICGLQYPENTVDVNQAKDQISYTFNISRLNQGSAYADCTKSATYRLELAVSGSGEKLFNNYRLTIEPPGGRNAVIQPSDCSQPLKGRTVSFSDPVCVNLLNTEPDIYYNLWWQGSSREWALQLKGTSSTNVMNKPIEVGKGVTGFTQSSGPKTLCMSISIGGYHLWPFSVGCDIPATYNFTLNPLPPPQPPPPPPGGTGSCDINIQAAHLPVPAENDSISMGATRLKPNTTYDVSLTGPIPKSKSHTANSAGWFNWVDFIDKAQIGTYKIDITDSAKTSVCSLEFEVNKTGTSTGSKGCPPGKVCAKVDITNCGDDPNPGIPTAIGCIHTNPAEFGKDFLRFAIGIGGGLAFLMMLLGVFQMMTSAGNPDTLKAGRERLTSAVIGLLFIIFSVLFLKIIGVDILKIPGFS